MTQLLLAVQFKYSRQKDNVTSFVNTFVNNFVNNYEYFYMEF